ncbi:GNAT family N-acetyltransferase [Sulfitobacter sp. W002]|uniref:GNAT family N-acetyltransferase n=1 Tax=Sulfitobacter sp. W002 TaxID=2867024 RepID=UPI0021A58A0D|nr:GNAT family N-acetyltransferase [Sulfitobacter sp. W002]UWR29841.1 GNAT family N-acetyltransferase [Sulfitobacter sp. W002]
MARVEVALRDAAMADHDALGRVMFDAIHHGASAYSAAERAAWLPAPPQGPQWSAKLGGQQVVLAERAGQVIGFMTRERGYIDLAFIAATAQGQGVFRALYGRVEQAAVAAGEIRLHTHASLMACPAFEALGFRVIAAERVARSGEYLNRFEMEKILT